jgi:O-antigen/teichoic acid export membrane protein
VSDDIKRRAVRGLFWSLLQGWGGKGVSLLLFLILARLLTPAQLGVASAINLVILLVGLIAEQGFGDAIVQRQKLEDADINLPFYGALGASTILSLVVVLLASDIEVWMNVPGLAPLLSVAVFSLPLMALSMFQEAMYRRQLLFKQVALRTLLTSTLSGVVGVICAYAGLGSWSLVIQAVAMTASNAVWLWFQPLWKPSRQLRWGSFRQILAFSTSVLATRVLDMIGTRAIDLLIVRLHGPAALGLYAVGSRIHQTLVLLLSSSVMSVSLGALSRVASDVPRLQRAYLKSLSASAALALPVFVGVAAVSPELAHLLFGGKWAGSGDIMCVLMLLGGFQSLQFMNTPALSALGHPSTVAWLALMKTVAAVALMMLVPTTNVVELTIVFAISQVLMTPILTLVLMRHLGIGLAAMLEPIAPFAAGAAFAYGAVTLGRGFIAGRQLWDVVSLPLLGALYALVYGAVVATFGRRQAILVWEVFRK